MLKQTLTLVELVKRLVVDQRKEINSEKIVELVVETRWVVMIDENNTE